MSTRLSAWAKQAALCAGFAVAHSRMALAAEGRPRDWQLNFQDAASPLAQSMHDFNNLLLAIMTAIVGFVLALLVWVIVRYSEKANPVPSAVTNNAPLEIIWTIVPVLILAVIAVPSFRLLFAQYDFPKADLTIKATGHQWYWSYSYPDNGNFSIDSYMLADSDRKPDQPRLLSVDNEVVVPAGKVVHVLVTSSDVIHSWAVPSFGVKADAVPGRITRLWFSALEPGVYYGQCSQLCGTDHAFMPIAVRAVNEQDFAAWLTEKQKSAANTPATRLAAR
jgi:cytochrome c oxidase subunit 2